MSFSEKLKSFQQLINERMVSDLPSSATRPARLHEAMNYSLQAGGKRLRPVLALAAHELFPGDLDPVPAAICLEIIHTYSLIHDDLPAMDNSDLRRGAPSCHRAFDEATAILAGDALIPLAFEKLATEYADHPEIALSLINSLARASGSECLVGGQMEDLLAEGQKPDEAILAYVHQNKTAAMIEASLVMGFRLGKKGDDIPMLDLMKNAGRSLGLAFQAVDDLLDVTSSSAELGKDAGNDNRNKKMTWVNMLGETKARELAKSHTEDALNAVRQVGGETQFLLELIEAMLIRVN